MSIVNSTKYFLKEGFKNVWINGIMSLASILVMVCCMILTGGAVLASMNLSSALKTIENKNSITVFLEKDITYEESQRVGSQIEQIPNVITCEYYPHHQAEEKYKDILGENLFNIIQQDDETAILPDAFHVTMEKLSLYDRTVEQIKAIEKIESISDRSETARRLSKLNDLVANAGIWIICSLGVVSLFIVSNTIRLTMYSRRFEINIMKSVGATNWFIRAPFIIEGIVIGLVAAGISTGILNLVYDGILKAVGDIISFSGVTFKNVFWYILAAFSLAGTTFGLLGGMISIRRYLKKEGGDVVAW